MVASGENAGNQHFLLIPVCFQKVFTRVVKIQDHAVKGLISVYSV